jgi:hypothetical protein
VLGHLGRGLALDALPAARAVRLADRREQHPEVVVDLAHRADGGARVAHRGPLVDRDRGREPGHRVHVRLLHLLEELARVGGEALHVSALPFGVERVEGQAALAGARRPGDHGQAVAGQVAVHAFQVVHPSAADCDGLLVVDHGQSAKTA